MEWVIRRQNWLDGLLEARLASPSRRCSISRTHVLRLVQPLWQVVPGKGVIASQAFSRPEDSFRLNLLMAHFSRPDRLSLFRTIVQAAEHRQRRLLLRHLAKHALRL